MSNNHSHKSDGLGLFKLTAFAIGTTLASGIFSVSADLANGPAGTLAVIIGWVIAGIGMFALSLCFYQLSVMRPDLDGGIFSYAKEGFDDYIGFNAAWGYWISAILSQVSFSTLLFAAIGNFSPVFGDGNNLISLLGASAILWLFTILVLNGVQSAVTVNTVIVIAKLIPILGFILLIILYNAFDLSVFLENFRGEDTYISLGRQILNTTYTTVWIFTGIEGAVIISGRARSTVIAGRATALSFLCLLVLYVAISLLSLGIMPRDQLASLPNPAMASILASVVGPWGGVMINIGVVISIAGAMFSYVILTADCAYAPAKLFSFPSFLSGENSNKAPFTALLTSALVIQLFLIIVYFQSSSYQALYRLATSAIMIPFFLSALYCLKLAFTHSLYNDYIINSNITSKIIAILGTIYGGWLLIATGIENILISALLFGPGFFFYWFARIENRKKLFPKGTDIITFIVISIGFVVSIYMISTGRIELF